MMNSESHGFWKRWRTPKRQEAAQQPQQTSDKQREGSRGSEFKSADRSELPRSPKELRALLREKLGLAGRMEIDKFDSEQIHECGAVLEETYLSMRVRQRQEVEKKFEDFFRARDDISTDVSALVEALKQERRICEAEALNSLSLVELLERRLVKANPGALKKAGQAAMARAGEVRAMLGELFALKRFGVKDLAADLDTIHRLAPALCGCLDAALTSSPDSTHPQEEWEEFFLEPEHRAALAAQDAAFHDKDARRVTLSFDYYQELFSLERAVQAYSATTPSESIKAMLDWPSANGYSERCSRPVQQRRAWFFNYFHELPQAQQEKAIPWFREAVFSTLVLDWSDDEPLYVGAAAADRSFIPILSLCKEPFAEELFEKRGVQELFELALQGRDRYADPNERLEVINERLESIEKQLGYLLGPERWNWNGEFDDEAASQHLLDRILEAEEESSIAVFEQGSRRTCSKYCDLLWDKAVSAILLEQKVTIVVSAYEQWRWLELMRRLSVIRLRGQHPGWCFGWRW